MAESDQGEKNSMRWRKTTTKVMSSTIALEEEQLSARDATITTTTTALNNNASTKPVVRTAANSYPTTDNVVHRITANPRHVKTQIAKISYTSIQPEKPKAHEIKQIIPIQTPDTSPCKMQSIEPNTIPNTTEDVFIKRKDERDREIQEIQNMLKEITKCPLKNPNGNDEESKTPHEDKVIPKESTKEKYENNTFRRSKTELKFDRPKAATTRHATNVRIGTSRIRSKSTQPPSTRYNENTSETAQKKKSYNAEDARRFMEEQKKKRRSQPMATNSSVKNSGEKSALEKEEIKKRLENLRKSSRQIVSNNLKRKHCNKNAVSTIASGDAAHSTNQLGKCEIVFKKPIDRKLLHKTATLTVLKDADAQEKCEKGDTKRSIEKSEPAIEFDEQKQSNHENDKYCKISTNTPIENHKRIGLLRKPETKDHSYSAIKDFSFDKENVAIEMMTPKYTIQSETRINENTNQCEPQNANKEPPHPTADVDEMAMKELQLELPSSRLKQPKTRAEKSTKIQETPSSLSGRTQEIKSTTAEKSRSTDLPYWLKPSAVQIYPYNFIMAVRRKLEAITNNAQPQATNPSELKQNIMKNQTTSTGDLNVGRRHHETPVSTVPKDRTNAKRRIIDDCAGESTDGSFATHTIEKYTTNLKVPDAILAAEQKQKSIAKSHSLSDLNSDFSSISIQLPNSNTVSEISSIKSENIIADKQQKTETVSKSSKQHKTENDDTTASSSIFSSPEKKAQRQQKQKSENDVVFMMPRPVSPLSLDRIENLKISSKVKVHETISTNNKQANAESSTRKEYHQNSKAEADNKDTSADVGLNFNKLLDDFNRSLSHVIQVNEQLKSTIDKSHEIFSPRRDPLRKTQTLDRTTDEYTTDFEESSSKRLPLAKHDQHQHVRPQQEILQHRKRNLFENANFVNPLLTSPPNKSASENDKGNLTPQLELNLESLANSSANSSESKVLLSAPNETSPSSASSAKEYEKRLVVIEKLKINLKESILNSRLNRQLEDRNANTDELTNAKQQNSSPPNFLRVDHIKLGLGKQDKTEIATIKSEQNTNYSKNTRHTNNESHKNSNSQIISTHSKEISGNTSHSGSTCRTISAKTHSTHETQTQHKSINNDDSKSITEELQNEYESPNKDNNDGNHNNEITNTITTTTSTVTTTKKSEENHRNYIDSHINSLRGDFLSQTYERENIDLSNAATAIATHTDNKDNTNHGKSPKAITSTTMSTARKDEANVLRSNLSNKLSIKRSNSTETIGSEIVAIFNQSELDMSNILLAAHHQSDNVSEISMNYSSIGLYEQLIRNETTKSEQLAILLKMREKALIDRTKSQIAWLEVQKERYKAKGLLLHIAAIKKKQRGILLKMEKEREEIKRLLQSTTSNTSTQSSARTRSPHRSRFFAATSTARQSSRHHDDIQKEVFRRPGTPPPPPALQLLTLPVAHIKTNRSSTQELKHGGRIRPSRSAPIVRANYELESSQTLEELLRKRESDLQTRRKAVERLMQWHQRLDQEEAEVLQLERMLLNCNNAHVQQSSTAVNLPAQVVNHPNENITDQKSEVPECETTSSRAVNKRAKNADKMERRLKEIDRSLRELSSISSTSNTNVSGAATTTTTSNNSIATDDNGNTDAAAASHATDYVRTTGSKLNKLWRRLTSQNVEKFEPNRRYKLCKSDLEHLYEEAKLVVLRDFAQDEQRTAAELLEKSTSNLSSSNSQTMKNTIDSSKVIVPSLNLNFSSGQSDRDEDSVAELSMNSLPQGNYSPSAAEENFIVSSSSKINSSHSETESNTTSQGREHDRVIQTNVQKFLSLKQHYNMMNKGIQRSLSDTQISKLPLSPSGSMWLSQNATSQRNISTMDAQQQNHRDFRKPIELIDEKIENTSPSATSYTIDTTSVENIQLPSSAAQRVSEESITSQMSLVNDNSKGENVFVEELLLNSVEKPSEIPEVTLISNESVEVTIANSSIEIAMDSESKAREISEKLDEISTAISKLSQDNPISIHQSTKNTSQLTAENVSSISSSTPSSSKSIIEENHVTNDTSYSSHFENVSTDRHSPSGFILKGNNNSIDGQSQNNETLTNNNEEITINSSPSATLKNASASSLQSRTFVSSSNAINRSEIENQLLDAYEEDFESGSAGEETCIDDISIPQFESTFDVTQEKEEVQLTDTDSIVKHEDSIELLAPPPPPTPPPPPPPPLTPAAASQQPGSSSSTTSSTSNGTQLMPDIINELEIRRCQQIFIENEHLKQYEHLTAVPYMYVREIPNKPPPPYVPPAHGSPMTTIFPSKERIQEITYRRTHELYCEILKTDYSNENGEKLPSVMEEKITNIYERIILDICREYLEEHQEVLTQGDPTNFRSQLAFFNPPDRLRCIQESVYKEVRRCLAMDKTSPKRTQVYSVYGQRAKRDHIGKIIIQEMYDEDDKWCNFHGEENEVLEMIVEEMINKNIEQLAKEVLIEEGGTVDENDNDEEEADGGEEENRDKTTSDAETNATFVDDNRVEVEEEEAAEEEVNAKTITPTTSLEQTNNTIETATD